MKDYQLRSFIAAAELGSFNKAAQSLYIAPSSFIQQINLLEASVGFKLFHRRATGAVLTEAGRGFLAAARSIIETYDEAVAQGRKIENEEQSTLKIGCAPEETPPFLRALYDSFAAQRPETQVTFVDSPYAQQLRDVEEENVDIVFLPESGIPLPPDLQFIPLYKDRYLLCMAPGHRLASYDLIAPEDLAGERIFIESVYRNEAANHWLIDYLESHSLEAILDDTPFSHALIMSLYMSGGVLPVPSRYVSAAAPPLTAVPFAVPESTFGLVYSRKGNPLASYFASHAQLFFQKSEDLARS